MPSITEQPCPICFVFFIVTYFQRKILRRTFEYGKLIFPVLSISENLSKILSKILIDLGTPRMGIKSSLWIWLLSFLSEPQVP